MARRLQRPRYLGTRGPGHWQDDSEVTIEQVSSGGPYEACIYDVYLDGEAVGQVGKFRSRIVMPSGRRTIKHGVERWFWRPVRNGSIFSGGRIKYDTATQAVLQLLDEREREQ